jgi:hypothetical protein
MKSLVKSVCFGAFTILSTPFRRSRPHAPRPTMDAATYAAMVAEAERIASPYKRHIAATATPQADEPGGHFPEVDALLERAGITV